MEQAARHLARSARFGFAAPRHFVLPAILLLLAEGPSYGYNVQKDLQSFGFGKLDRPATYRGLAQLEADNLVESWQEPPTAGQARRMYAITEAGSELLKEWMSVIEAERNCLDRVLRRYHTVTLRQPLESDRRRSPEAVVPNDPSSAASGPRYQPLPACTDHPNPARLRFSIDGDHSALLIETRSTAGRVSFATLGLSGWVEGDFNGGQLADDPSPSAHIEVDLASLTSGNAHYDAELLRRIQVQRFPVACLELRSCQRSGQSRFHLTGELEFHGSRQRVEGSVGVSLLPGPSLSVTGEQFFDVRDFGIPCPSTLMLRFYPDVRIRLRLDAVAANGG